MEPNVESLHDTVSKYDKSGLVCGDGSRSTRAKLSNVTIRPIVVRDKIRAKDIG